jgi:hypothetical protein
MIIEPQVRDQNSKVLARYGMVKEDDEGSKPLKEEGV